MIRKRRSYKGKLSLKERSLRRGGPWGEPGMRGYELERENQAENRRKLIASLDPDAAELAQREFAKLGLTQ